MSRLISSTVILQIQEFRIKNGDGTFSIIQSSSDSNVGILYTQSAFDRESVPKDVRLVKTLIVEAIDSAPSSVNPPAHNTGKSKKRQHDKTIKMTCTQRRLGSACALAQSDQSLFCPQEKTLGPQLPIERTVKTDLSLRWAHMSFCWFCRAAAYICFR